jgi:hypothetical protein
MPQAPECSTRGRQAVPAGASCMHVRVRVQVVVLERRLATLASVPETLRALHASVDRVATAQAELRCDVSQHCTHSSALISQLQVRACHRTSMHGRACAGDPSGWPPRLFSAPV